MAEKEKLQMIYQALKDIWFFPRALLNQALAAKEDAVILGGVKALNRGMASFCSEDKRMFGVAYIPFRFGPEVTLELLSESIKNNFSTILIDTIAPNNSKAFTHPDF